MYTYVLKHFMMRRYNLKENVYLKLAQLLMGWGFDNVLPQGKESAVYLGGF